MSNEDNNKKSYTCPMHPKVKSDAPGDCPKCGMNLVLEGSEPEKNSEEKDSYTPLLN